MQKSQEEISSSRETVEKKKSEHLVAHANITIMKPANEIYRFWRDLSNLPRFTKQLEAVDIISEKMSHWTWRALKGQKKVEWDSEIIEDRPGRLLSWRTVGNPEVQHLGAISFQELPHNRGAVVDIKLFYDPPGGKLTDMLLSVLGESPLQKIKADLFKLRDIMETGEIPTIEGQPRGGLH